MSMKAELRIQKLQEIEYQSESCGSKRIIYKSKKNQDMLAYEIPVAYLVYNKYNARIGTFVKTHEKQHGEIDVTTKKGEELIVDFLWRSNIKRNQETLRSIREEGQSIIGIVTKDGVVIDGNRRCMLLKKISENTYFRAIILSDTSESDPKEIRKLETIYQMGVDEKVDYNPIEKYLKCKDLHEEDHFKLEEIGKMMGEKSPDIKKYLEILKLMEEYLKFYGYDGMYNRLSEEAVEGPFVDLTGYLKKHETGTKIQGRDWEPKKEDIDDLKHITFDYIRAGFRTIHGIRDIGNTSKGQGFFSDKKIWKEFLKRYLENVDPINDEEKPLDEWRNERPDEDVDNIIRAREKDWVDRVKPKLKENYGKTRRGLDDKAEADSPMELLQRAETALNSINTDSEGFNEDVLDQVKKINSIVWDFQQIH